MLNTEFVVGIAVTVAPSANQDSRTIADALALVLNKAGILTARSNDLPDESFPMPAVGPAPEGKIAPIRMLVGTKPE